MKLPASCVDQVGADAGEVGPTAHGQLDEDVFAQLRESLRALTVSVHAVEVRRLQAELDTVTAHGHLTTAAWRRANGLALMHTLRAPT